MKITGICPALASNKAEEIASLFEDLGFHTTHTPAGATAAGTIAVTRMKHENGYHVDVVALDKAIPQDMIAIRMNVDDFDEAYSLLTAYGFEIAPGDKIVDLGFAKMVMMVSPSGFMINLIQHIKNHD